MKIYKYPIDINSDAISMPGGAKILSVQAQDGKPMVWAAVKDGATTIKCKMKIVPTGGDVEPTDMPWYKGTVIDGAGLVWHVFIFI
jgi:Na+-transporting NADH:ubiquinone oxidoreductase subunit NqrF